MYPTIFVVLLRFLAWSIPVTCNPHQNPTENPTEELIETPSQQLLSIGVPPTHLKTHPIIQPPPATCAGMPFDKPSIPNFYARAKIQDYCNEITSTPSHSRLHAGSHISMSYPIGPGTENSDYENELWFSIAWNPKCGAGKTRLVRSRCEAALNSLLERCNVDSMEKWGGQVVGTCLVYNMSSIRGKSCEPLVAVVNETISIQVQSLISGAGRTNEVRWYPVFEILVFAFTFVYLLS